MVRSILVGLVLTMITVGIHALGTSWWIERLINDRKQKLISGNRFRELKTLFTTATLLLFLHILEVIVWAGSYLMIPDLDHLQSLEEASYFSIVTFTSLGYGDIVLSGRWRLLSGIQSMAGLFVFGWSTALLFAIFQRLWQSNPPD